TTCTATAPRSPRTARTCCWSATPASCRRGSRSRTSARTSRCCRTSRGLPADAPRRLHRWPPADLAHSILSAVCAGHFRFLTPIVERHLGVPEPRFWALVREAVDAYHARFPELAERFAWFDLLAPRVARVTLNRGQLIGEGFPDRA